MRVLSGILILLLFSCSFSQKDRIVVPELHARFYVEAMDRINAQLKSDSNNTELIDQKLFYCEQLYWPVTCMTALDSYRKLHGVNNQLIEQYITYYQKHEQHQFLFDIIEKWDNEFNLKTRFNETYIDVLTRLNKNNAARDELEIFLESNQSIHDVSFASLQYLRMYDTTMATYTLGKLHELDSTNDLMWEYGNILISLSYPQRGLDILSHYIREHQDDLTIQLAYAGLLRKSGELREARRILKPHTSTDTVSYLLADWYKEGLMWDSSAYILKNLAMKDSTNRKPVWMLGTLYEERGWFSYSLRYFRDLAERDSSDTLVVQKINDIQRKITYLQRLKFEESKIPIIELKPIKIKN